MARKLVVGGGGGNWGLGDQMLAAGPQLALSLGSSTCWKGQWASSWLVGIIKGYFLPPVQWMRAEWYSGEQWSRPIQFSHQRYRFPERNLDWKGTTLTSCLHMQCQKWLKCASDCTLGCEICIWNSTNWTCANVHCCAVLGSQMHLFHYLCLCAVKV